MLWDRYCGLETPFWMWLSPSMTRNRAKNTGRGRRDGRQLPNGLTLCSLNRSIWAWANAWRSFLCCSWSFFSCGWSFCMASIDRVVLSVSGEMMIIHTTASTRMAMP